jgi:hypothetical protein
MLKPVTIATVALLLSHATSQKDKHTGRFGGLAVSVTALQIAEAKKIPNQHYVVVFATIKNVGKKAACASFVTRLKGTYDLEYSEGVLGYVATRPDVPRPPAVSQMLPGEEARGAYVFIVKDGVAPLELSIKLQGKSIHCNAPSEGAWGDTFLPQELRLDVHDLPTNEDDSKANGK